MFPHLSKIQDYAKSYMKQINIPAHNWLHVYRVLKLGRLIAGTDKDANLFLVECSCLLHDLGRVDEFLCGCNSISHAKISAQKSEEFLMDLNILSDEELNIVLTSISEHDSTKEPTFILIAIPRSSAAVGTTHSSPFLSVGTILT